MKTRLGSAIGTGPTRALCRFAMAGALSTVLAVVFAQSPVHADATDALPYTSSFLITGNYVVGGVDLTHNQNPAGPDGLVTGTINISGVPANADILAAYMYWETIHPTGLANPEAGVLFDGQAVNNPNVQLLKRTPQVLGTGASCYSSGNQSLTLTMLKADVLHVLPLQRDVNGESTGKRLVNGAHTVKVPATSGNQALETAGVSLFVVYRDPESDPLKNPLRKIVVYDGLKIQPNLATPLTQTLKGFYKSSATALAPGIRKAQISYLVASGQPNQNERVFFNDSSNHQILTDPFSGANSAE